MYAFGGAFTITIVIVIVWGTTLSVRIGTVDIVKEVDQKSGGVFDFAKNGFANVVETLDSKDESSGLIEEEVMGDITEIFNDMELDIKEVLDSEHVDTDMIKEEVETANVFNKKPRTVLIGTTTSQKVE